MLQFRDPCKKCLVRPSCSKGCKEKQKYYSDRDWKIGTIYAVLLSIAQLWLWIGLCFVFPSFPQNGFYKLLFVVALGVIAVYTAFKYNVFNLEGSRKSWMD